MGGFLYDADRLGELETRWAKRTRNLEKPFHAYDCFWGRDQFEGWPEPVRHLLMHDLAQITADTKLAGFVAFIERRDWDQWKQINQTEIVQRVGSPYSACLLHCITMAADLVRTRYPDQDVTYFFEAGCNKQREAEQFLYDLERNAQTRARLKINGHAFALKSKEIALGAADLLVWQWQRNYIELLRDSALGEKGLWTSDFWIIFKSKNIYIKGLADGSLNVRAIVNFFNAHQPTNR